ncbi:LacI family DNA-binding transcriptional regulator [Streptomyces sp. NPDC020898]|uniref:LacI family DNA-binding transcriptional regulator n=1 Tax=Streptomyces sp. NPDC020898 TaxID=3365101 RepID=UPI0037A4D129
MARLRLADIAKKAGVSEASVSRVLNDKNGVSHRTRQVVLDALQESGVASGRSVAPAGLIALVTPELTKTLVASLVQELEEAIRRSGYVAAVCVQASDTVFSQEAVDLLVERGVGGIIFVSGWPGTSTLSADTRAGLRGLKLPCVFVNGPDGAGDAPFVSVDHNAAMRMAVQHLVELGHDRIGMVVGHHRNQLSARRSDGFVAALEEARCPDAATAADRVHHTLPTIEGGRTAVGALLEKACTGILCDSDLAALGVIQALKERGLSVPKHISVVTFNDSPFMEFTRPPLTAVRQPVESIAMTAIATLLADGVSSTTQHREFMLQPELIVRGSTSARWPRLEAVLAEGAGA